MNSSKSVLRRTTSTQTRAMTRILISISITYLLTTLPYAIYNMHRTFLAMFIFKIYPTNSLEYYKQYYISSITNEVGVVLFNLNSAINFWLYIVSGSTFRDELKAILCCKGTLAVPLTPVVMPDSTNRTTNVNMTWSSITSTDMVSCSTHGQ